MTTESTIRDLLDQAAADDQAIAEREARIQAGLAPYLNPIEGATP